MIRASNCALTHKQLEDFLLSIEADKANLCVDTLHSLGYSRCCEIGIVVDTQQGVKSRHKKYKKLKN